MMTIHDADRVDDDWQMQAETALAACLAYAGAVTAAAMAASAGNAVFVVGATSVCGGALGAVVAITVASVVYVLSQSAGRRTLRDRRSAARTSRWKNWDRRS